MRVLIIGGGGREHALAWAVKKSSLVKEVFAIPGNPGISKLGKSLSLDKVDSGDLLKFVTNYGIDFTIVGPEYHLSKGLVDSFLDKGLKIFGPDKGAAQIESSKVFAKTLMAEEGIMTAPFEIFDDIATASRYIKGRRFPLVVKVDGLAQGKGVFICKEVAEAEKVLYDVMIQGIFGEAGKKVVIEEFLDGVEVSYMVVTDGENFIPLPTSRDHKRLMDGDMGPNTGGMGAISPSPDVSKDIEEKIKMTIFRPILHGLKKIGRRFRGVLYAGIMLHHGEPYVLEFNARFGDPETQAIVMRLEDDIVPILMDAACGEFSEKELKIKDDSSFTLVLAQEGYPGRSVTGKVITGLESISEEEAVIFHAGTRIVGGKLVTWGGRVLSVNTTAKDIQSAGIKAYAVAEKIQYDGKFYRKDIGKIRPEAQELEK